MGRKHGLPKFPSDSQHSAGPAHLSTGSTRSSALEPLHLLGPPPTHLSTGNTRSSALGP